MDTDEVYYFNAYQDLSTCRYHEGGFIPWVATKDYVLTFGGSIDDVEFMSRFCNHLDELVFAEMRTKEPGKTGDKSGRKSKRILGEKDGTAKS